MLFTVTSFVPPNTKVGVIGCWDGWKSVVELTPTAVTVSHMVPTTYSGVVNLSRFAYRKDSMTVTPSRTLEFKYVRWHSEVPFVHPNLKSVIAYCSDDIVCPTLDDLNGVNTLYNTSDLHCLKTPTKGPVPRPLHLEWEGSGGHDNRVIESVCCLYCNKETDVWTAIETMDYEIDSGVKNATPSTVSTSSTNITPNAPNANCNHLYALPPHELHDNIGQDEFSHTTRYYFSVKGRNALHFHPVLTEGNVRFFVGTCPRSVEHVRFLRDTYNVGFVLNLQSFSDLIDNRLHGVEDALSIASVSDGEELSGLLSAFYRSLDVGFVHVPTVDMSTPARASLMAQAAALLYMRVQKVESSLDGISGIEPVKYKNIYIHCNAGVGRAVASMLSYLAFVKKVPLSEAILIMKQRRTVAYPDPIAAKEGKKDWALKFGSI